MRLLFLIAVIGIFPALIQNSKCGEPERPKVALVLSGGSAKGIAHIGILKVLEQVGIKPDIITGTSMGSIVGGLYSIGYSAKELDSLVSVINWDDLLSNNISQRDVVMEEKNDYNKFLVEFPIYNKKVHLPSGLIEGQKISELFSKLCWRAVGIEHFDHFPIQYRCVASDIINGNIVVFEEGDLATAMRSSMAIPSLFSPVFIDTNKLLVDGGVMRNFPVQEAIDLGANIVIGVYVGFKDDAKPEDINSITDVLTRSSTFYGMNDYTKQINKVDIYIEPDMTGINGNNFNASGKIIERGEQAALSKLPELKKLAAYLDSFPQRPIKLLPDPELIYINEIRVRNNNNLTRDFILAKTGIKEKTWISKKDIEDALDKVYGTRFVDKISYEFSPSPVGFILTFVVKESHKSFIKSSVRYDSDFGAGVNTNLTMRNFLLANSKLSSTIYISKIPRFNFYYSQYFGQKQSFILSNGGIFEKNTIPLYRNGNRIGSFGHRYFEYFLATKYTYSPNHLLEIKGAYEYAEIKPSESVKVVFPEMNFKMYGYGNFSLTTSYEINFRNHKYYPTWGNHFKITYKKSFKPIIDLQQEESVVVIDTGFFNTNLEQYYVMQIKFGNVKRFTKRFIVEDEIMLGLTSDQTVVSELFFVGGINNSFRHNCIPFAGFNMMEKTFQKFLKLDLKLNFKLNDKVYFTVIGNVLKEEKHTESLIFDLFKKEVDDTYLGYAAGFKYKSFIGPCMLMFGQNNKDDFVRIYLSLGHEF